MYSLQKWLYFDMAQTRNHYFAFNNILITQVFSLAAATEDITIFLFDYGNYHKINEPRIRLISFELLEFEISEVKTFLFVQLSCSSLSSLVHIARSVPLSPRLPPFSATGVLVKDVVRQSHCYTSNSVRRARGDVDGSLN